MPDLIDTIVENAEGPKKAQGDSGSVEQHPIPDQIELDRYKRAIDAQQTNSGGLKFRKLSPPGTA